MVGKKEVKKYLRCGRKNHSETVKLYSILKYWELRYQIFMIFLLCYLLNGYERKAFGTWIDAMQNNKNYISKNLYPRTAPCAYRLVRYIHDTFNCRSVASFSKWNQCLSDIWYQFQLKRITALKICGSWIIIQKPPNLTCWFEKASKWYRVI